MRVTDGGKGEGPLGDAFNSVVFEADDGQELIVYVRDGAFEIALRDMQAKDPTGGGQRHYRWFSVSSNGIKERVCQSEYVSDVQAADEPGD